ncbi:MAG: VWA domain-containing protein [Bryobacteraceae bacterium]|nr:VWA domain-containing protein [Bryobacteraceae bacterium]
MAGFVHLDHGEMKFALSILTLGASLGAQDTSETYKVDVDLLVLNFTVLDSRGHYVQGLRPQDVVVREDGVAQSLKSFSESSGRVRIAEGTERNVFVLFDTSNGMYGRFAHAQEAVLQFLRELDPNDRVALYTFSKNMHRAQRLTSDRSRAMAAVRNAVVGAETGLYNSLLLTLRDAAKVKGDRVVVVFSNGADNASIVGPDDVRRVAEEEGVPIYVVAAVTDDAVSGAVFERLTTKTGGRLQYAQRWDDQVRAFRLIREEFANSYVVTYYPGASDNDGFRRLEIQMVGRDEAHFTVRARPGYKRRTAAVKR